MKNRFSSGFMTALLGGMLVFSSCSIDETQQTSTVKTYSAKLLSYPTGTGKTNAFISLGNGQIYGVSSAAETFESWDFGYYAMGAESGGAHLSSTNAFPSMILNVREEAGIDSKAPLNKCYFHLSTKTEADFNAVDSPDDFDKISIEASLANERVKGLVAGSIVELVNHDGKKGLIKVNDVNISKSAEGYIKMDIKMQP